MNGPSKPSAETPESKRLRLAVCDLRLLLDMRVSDGYDQADVVNEAVRHLKMYKDRKS